VGNRLDVVKHWYEKAGSVSPDDFQWLIEQAENAEVGALTMKLTKEQLDKIRNKLFQQQDKPCNEGQPTFHEALGFECGMMFMSEILGLDWEEISKR
jgi:hypothetical protein